MAKATAECTCRECGKTFERSRKCYNRAEANGWEAWARENIALCPDCYRRSIERQEARIAERYKLPELTAVSERQKAYAIRRRNKFVSGYADEMDKYIHYERKREEPEWRRVAAEACAVQGKTLQQYIDEVDRTEPWTRCRACLHETDAGKLLDVLT